MFKIRNHRDCFFLALLAYRHCEAKETNNINMNCNERLCFGSSSTQTRHHICIKPSLIIARLCVPKNNIHSVYVSINGANRKEEGNMKLTLILNRQSANNMLCKRIDFKHASKKVVRATIVCVESFKTRQECCDSLCNCNCIHSLNSYVILFHKMIKH